MRRNGNVRFRELSILAALARQCRPGSNLFEIGTFDGRTTFNLALNAPRSCAVHTLDLPPATGTVFPLANGEQHFVDKPAPGNFISSNAARSGCPAPIQRHFGDSAAFDFSPFFRSCSFVFVDGSHALDYVRSDSANALRLIESGGTIVWHDYGVWGGVTQALEELHRSTSLAVQHIRGTSLALLRQP